MIILDLRVVYSDKSLKCNNKDLEVVRDEVEDKENMRRDLG